MGNFEIFMTALSLSIDAMAVSVTKGLAFDKINIKKILIIAFYFGFFQAIMPLMGYYLSSSFSYRLSHFGHYIAFILLSLISFTMIKESFSNEEKDSGEKDESKDAGLSIKVMLPLAFATSIDALAIGVSFSFLIIDIVTAILFIGFITFTVTALGARIGHFFGNKLKKRAELLGGIVLLFIGFKILFQHILI